MIHFHDLRHTGNQLAADAGANLRELMDRMGHSTTRAAMATCMAVTSGSKPSPTRSAGKPQPRSSGLDRTNRARSGHGGGEGHREPRLAVRPFGR
jgi:hypothetical protein